MRNIFNKKEKEFKPEYPHSGYLDKRQVRFMHSGKSGDIIYAIPAMREMNRFGNDIELYLNIIQPHSGKVDKHFNEKTVEMLLPLLQYQPYLKKAGIFSRQSIDVDMDAFRFIDIPLDRSNLASWYSFAFNVFPDLTKPWLYASKKEEYSNCIALSRSKRYGNPNLSRVFLSGYKDLAFLGTEQEYKSMKAELPSLVWIKVDNFLEMADIINSCKLFIGNQSMPFAIAEALKVQRVLEVSLESPNVIPFGPNGFGCIYQDAFEETVKKCISRTTFKIDPVAALFA